MPLWFGQRDPRSGLKHDPPHANPGIGSKVIFHGSFQSKGAAEAKHKEVPGSYVHRSKTKRGIRYLVLVRRD